MTRQQADRISSGCEARERAQERLAAALALLEEGIGAIIDGPSFARYLQAMARFHAYSARNVALIHVQRPAATRVAGYRAWQTLGRQVRKGEQGIRIIVPHRRTSMEADEEGEAASVSGFGVATVFDVRQTDGDPLPPAPTAQLLAGVTDAGAWLWDRLAGFLAGEGITLAREDTGWANGAYWGARRRIAVHPRLTGDQATKTLAHEVAHHVADTRIVGRGGVASADAETIAEGAAFVTLHHFGIDTSGYSFPYVAGWARDRAVFVRNLEAVRATAHTMIRTLEGESMAADEAPVEGDSHFEDICKQYQDLLARMHMVSHTAAEVFAQQG